MAQPWCTGPQHIYVGFRNGQPASVVPKPLYYGTTRGGVEPEDRPEYTPIMNDLSGGKVPFDRMYEGEESYISLDMTRWNILPDLAMDALPFVGVQAARGANGYLDRGTIMGLEGATIALWVVNPFAVKAAYSGMQRGRYFGSCVLIGPNKWSGGNRENSRHRVFVAQSFYDINNRSFTRWSDNKSLFTGLPDPD